MSKSKIIGWVIASPFILVALGVAFCEANKAYWDHQVKLMCEKDGGVTVYERIELTKEEYERNDGRNGVIRVMSDDTSPPKHQYAWNNTDQIIHDSNPEVWRSEYNTFRKLDGKTLGKWVTYTRRGGDFPAGIMSDSYYSCSDIPSFESSATTKIFTIIGE